MFLFLCFFMNALLCSLVTGSEKAFFNSSPRIVGGKVANITNHPYVAYLKLFHNYFLPRDYSECVAVILSKDWLLTAAHCFDDPYVRAYIHAGSSEKLGKDGLYTFIKPPVIHPYYDKNSSDYDFALVMTNVKIDFSGTIDYLDLPTDEDEIRNGDLCWTAGWGDLTRYKSVDDAPDEADLLHEVMLPIFSHSICNELIYGNTLTKRMICAGYANATSFKSPCSGDSGAPLVCERLLFGILSFRKDYEPCGKNPAVFGRVKSIRKWIENETGIEPKK
ncbi:trypsin 3A1-like isoform X2 [Sitodiplosis mosellana]|uniref:trypsin 3A1-like isoform X2 n=1 Tax=Sitodiplosis mosellana TaxID=263140 RepID=UPI0024448823|nr:trypsin 3A1-like isoform X2 [Sitodiplosis mosellana]